MMLNEITNTQKTTWASISNGNIVVRSTEDDPKAKSRINKKGIKVFERYYASIAGKIKNLSIEDNVFGEKEVKVGLENGDNLGVLTIKVDSSYGRSFMAQIFNVDLSKAVVFNPWIKKLEDTTKSALYLNYEDRTKVDYKLPQGTPTVNWVDLKGKKVIDNISMIQHQDFLEETLRKFIVDNGLGFVKYTPAPKEENEFTAPLSKEEKKELADMKKNAKTKKGSEQSDDDFFNDL